LSDIDCPERKQDYYQKCKDAISEMCFNKIVTVISAGKDRYGRILGKVLTSEGLNVNHELVRTGFAWNFTRYSTDPQLIKLEIHARELKLGLWSQANPIPPWEYRQSKKKITSHLR
jgi:endonuclease YncB( thermonuclease family)